MDLNSYGPKLMNHSILLESLLLTLKMCLPSFKFASGAQLGDELHVQNVGSEISSFKVLRGNIFSQTEPIIIELAKLEDFESDSRTDSESDVDPDTDSLGCSGSGKTLKDLFKTSYAKSLYPKCMSCHQV